MDLFWQQHGMTDNLYTLSPHYAQLAESLGMTVGSRNPDGYIANVPCPPLLPDYQLYIRICGIDQGEQLIGCYNAGRWSK